MMTPETMITSLKMKAVDRESKILSEEDKTETIFP